VQATHVFQLYQYLLVIKISDDGKTHRPKIIHAEFLGQQDTEFLSNKVGSSCWRLLAIENTIDSKSFPHKSLLTRALTVHLACIGQSVCFLRVLKAHSTKTDLNLPFSGLCLVCIIGQEEGKRYYCQEPFQQMSSQQMSHHFKYYDCSVLVQVTTHTQTLLCEQCVVLSNLHVFDRYAHTSWHYSTLCKKSFLLPC